MTEKYYEIDLLRQKIVILQLVKTVKHNKDMLQTNFIK